MNRHIQGPRAKRPAGRYSLAIIQPVRIPVEVPLTAVQLRMLATYEGRDPEPFAAEVKTTRAPFQGWRVP